MKNVIYPYQLSLIIPTHNRALGLKKLLENLEEHNLGALAEIVIVNNNSTDDTEKIVASSQLKNKKYVFEENTSFTKARLTGAQEATGDILIFMDDDVAIEKGTFEEVVKIFQQYPNAGVVGGKILPRYEQTPPEWVLSLDKAFDVLCLHDKGPLFQEVDATPGPFMAMRRKTFFAAGGFPPDTVGVETNSRKKTIKKLYIGPGDYGLCINIKQLGFKNYYSPNIIVHHIIPPIRLTKQFWVSRVIGDGYAAAVTQKNMPSLNFGPSQRGISLHKKIATLYLKKLLVLPSTIFKKGLVKNDLALFYYKAFRDMQRILEKNKGLAEHLWQVGYNGIADKNFDSFTDSLPKELQILVLR